MQLRCKSGGLALVLYDTPPCESNVGRFVHVRGPVHLNQDLRLWCWLIKPVSRTAWCVEDESGEVHTQIVFWISEIEHPDAWLLPIRPNDVAERDVVQAQNAAAYQPRQPSYVTVGNSDMTDLKTAASLQDRIDKVIREQERKDGHIS